MSIEDKGACPPAIKTVLEICQATLVEAQLNNADALSAASMMLGFVCLNMSETEDDAHCHFSDCIFDIHKYIEANWEQVQEMRRRARSKRK